MAINYELTKQNWLVFQVGPALYSLDFFKFEYLLPEFSRKWVPVNVSLFLEKAALKFFDDYIIPFFAKQLLFVAFL